MKVLRLSARAPYVLVTIVEDGQAYDYVGMVDTGASMTAVHPDIIRELRPMPLGQVDIKQVGDNPIHPRFAPTYYLKMKFGATSKPSPEIGIEVVAAIPSSACQILIGRDIISRWIVTLDGPEDRLVIAM